MKTITNITYLAFALFAFACFALAPQARAVCQEGCDLGLGNTFLGDDALINNTTGFESTAIGADALSNNTTGSDNTAIGAFALNNNTTGGFNTAIGALALRSNTLGSSNTATGFWALLNNTTGVENTASGFEALFQNTTGSGNTATGSVALFSNTTGSNNTATGGALSSNTTGSDNTASGVSALQNNTTGSDNIALGYQAGSNLTTGSHNIDIGARGVADESRTIRIGNHKNHSKTLIAGIRDVTTGNADAIPVLIDSDGQLGTMSSSRRFKTEIKPMDRTSEAILGLKPVTFQYKSDSKSTPQFGLIAEEVAQVNPDLVVRDENGEIYTVRYEAVNAMLLNEFLKEHRKVEEQGATIARQQKQIEALTAGLQQVKAQVETSPLTPQTVVSKP